MKTLYRPVGEKEMLLIAESGFKNFPSRLEQQPIFYPVLNEEYASEIAEKWNTTDPFGNFLGFVTKFSITEEEFNKYQIENVGGKIHNELWVPSEDLDVFNSAIVGEIEVVKVYIGKEYQSSDSTIIKELIGKIERIEK
ncbi:ADP-ribosylation/crystallin J1 [Tenacibaculum sp. 190524A05c]|uniref:ADP-ribosylation/crystallin J1 n=1 Tax=Tenacibaculum platacis TaxID=3137852 RepID=UPI0032B171F3